MLSILSKQKYTVEQFVVNNISDSGVVSVSELIKVDAWRDAKRNKVNGEMPEREGLDG